MLAQFRHPRNVSPRSPPNNNSSFVGGVLEFEYGVPRRVKTDRHTRPAMNEMGAFMALIFPLRCMTIQEERPGGGTQVVTIVTICPASRRGRAQQPAILPVENTLEQERAKAVGLSREGLRRLLHGSCRDTRQQKNQTFGDGGMGKDGVTQDRVRQPSKHCRLNCRHHFARFSA